MYVHLCLHGRDDDDDDDDATGLMAPSHICHLQMKLQFVTSKLYQATPKEEDVLVEFFRSPGGRHHPVSSCSRVRNSY